MFSMKNARKPKISNQNYEILIVQKFVFSKKKKHDITNDL